jgi:DNA-binding GntR family transcriptional regulator
VAPDGAELFQTRKFSDIAGELIRGRILAGELPPGARINEVTLSEELKISRPPLREALRVLGGEGLVTIVPGKGAYVVDLDVQSLSQVGEIRMALECASARLAAERSDEHDVARMQQVMDAIERELADEEMPYPHHIDFHQALATATKNPRLATSLEEVVRQLRLTSMQTNEDPRRAHQVLIEHRAVTDAVLRGDVDGAEKAMRDHIQASNEAMVARLGGKEGITDVDH